MLVDVGPRAAGVFEQLFTGHLILQVSHRTLNFEFSSPEIVLEQLDAESNAERWLQVAMGWRLIMNEDWRSRITMEPGKRGGRPCIRGMRITVFDVLSYLAAGMTMAELLADLPYLTADDIQACLAYTAERERSMLVLVE